MLHRVVADDLVICNCLGFQGFTEALRNRSKYARESAKDWLCTADLVLVCLL